MAHLLDHLRDPDLPANQRTRVLWRQAREEFPDDYDAQVDRYRELLGSSLQPSP